MSAIREFVMQEPLFDAHEHQHGFTALEKRRDEMDYREFCGYVGADMETARGVGPEAEAIDLATVDGFFHVWRFVRTTGYGQATEMACSQLTGLEFTRENAEAITEAVRGAVRGKTGAEVYADILGAARVRWAVSDECWDSPTKLHYFEGGEHPEFFRHALRCDDILVMTAPEDVATFEKASGRTIHTLRQLDDAMDDYAERARKAGKMAAFKAGMPYRRRLDFDNSSFSDAERAFQAIMQGTSTDPKPLHDYLFHRLMIRAADMGLPVQLHTGYLAGCWRDPSFGDPTPLIPVLQRYKTVRFDLFHACWPYSEVATAIGKTLPNVYLDLCWAWAMNPAQMERVLDEWLAAVPHNKIFAFGADTGTPFATLGYAVQARQGIANVLERKVQRGEYDAATAEDVARRIMHANAQQVYGME